MAWSSRPQQDMVNVRFQLFGEEARELKTWAAHELRLPTHQVRYLLRQEMARRRQAQADRGRLPDAAGPQSAAGPRPE